MFIYRDDIKITFELKSVQHVAEIVRSEFNIVNKKFVIVAIYRLHTAYGPFIEKMYELLEEMQLDHSSNSFLIGDFNIKVDLKEDNANKALNKTLQEIGFKQLVDFPTHDSLHTLDLLITNSESLVTEVFPTAHVKSDHRVVNCLTEIESRESLKHKTVFKLCRNWSKLNLETFHYYFLEKMEINNFLNIYDPDDLIHLFNEICKAVLDDLVPARKKRVKQNKIPFFDDELCKMRQNRRRLERKFKQTKCSNDWENYKKLCEDYSDLIVTKKSTYYKTKLQKTDSKNLFKTCKKLMSLDKGDTVFPTASSDVSLAENFNKYFIDKISNIRIEIPEKDSPVYVSLPEHSSLYRFSLVTDTDVQKAIALLSNKQSKLDVIPTWLLKKLATPFLPFITHIINASFSSQTFPPTLKDSIIFPTIKKPKLDKEVLKNYRPVSNIAFLSKILEKIVCSQIEKYITDNNLDEIYQSGYKKGHSVETALTKILNDIYVSKEKKRFTALCLIDLSAAFDTIDHDILFKILENKLKIIGPALNWLKSFMTGRKQSVCINDSISSKLKINYGVPQGTLLGPKIFSMYMLPLYEIFKLKNIKFHGYADDTQFYLETTKNSLDEIKNSIKMILQDIKDWLDVHKLKMNPDKTEIIVIGSDCEIQLNFGNQILHSSPTVRNLGILLDKKLTFNDYITNVSRECFAHLRNISRNRKFMDFETCKKITNSLVLSKINFCCTLLYGLPKKKIDKLQKLQNYAARIITLASKRDRITPLLKKLNWLTVEKFIEYRLITMIYKCINNTAPPYLCNLVEPYVPTRTLRSSSLDLLDTPFMISSLGRRAFSFTAPTIWNNLPTYIRYSDTENILKTHVKQYLLNSLE